jgi:hypothetical protein
MEQVERLVKERAKQSDGRFSASFLDQHYFELEV